jgi:hypothetical protein
VLAPAARMDATTKCPDERSGTEKATRRAAFPRRVAFPAVATPRDEALDASQVREIGRATCAARLLTETPPSRRRAAPGKPSEGRRRAVPPLGPSSRRYMSFSFGGSSVRACHTPSAVVLTDVHETSRGWRLAMSSPPTEPWAERRDPPEDRRQSTARGTLEDSEQPDRPVRVRVTNGQTGPPTLVAPHAAIVSSEPRSTAPRS